MILTLIISDNCKACDRAKIALNRIQLKHPQVTVETIHINSFNGRRVSITPALLVDNKMFCYGDIDETKLLAKLN